MAVTEGPVRAMRLAALLTARSSSRATSAAAVARVTPAWVARAEERSQYRSSAPLPLMATFPPMAQMGRIAAQAAGQAEAFGLSRRTSMAAEQSRPMAEPANR